MLEVAGSPTRWRVLWVLAALVALANLDLFSVDVGLPREEMVDRISAIIYAAFHLV